MKTSSLIISFIILSTMLNYLWFNVIVKRWDLEKVISTTVNAGRSSSITSINNSFISKTPYRSGSFNMANTKGEIES